MVAVADDQVTFNPRLVIGPMQIGGLLSALLFGILTMQIFVYFTMFRGDRLILKVIVTAVAVFQLCHFICLSAALWTMTVTAYDNPSVLAVFPLGAEILILFSSFTASLTQSFYAHRLWKLSEAFILLIISGMLCLAAQIAAFMLVIEAVNMTTLQTFENQQHVLIVFASLARASGDIFTTTGIVWALKSKSTTAFAMATVVDQITLWTIETGLITSLMALTISALFLSLRNYVWFGLYLMHGNVVANSLLASMNRRLKPTPVDSSDHELSGLVIRTFTQRTTNWTES